jgi:hypothetical protein
MSLLPIIGSGDPDTGFYNGVATQSVRSDRSGGSTLSKTLGTPTTRRRWTISFWIKRTALGNGVNATNSYNPLMGCDNKLIARFDINDKFQLYDYDGNFDVNLVSTMMFRDTSAWYNIVVVADIDGQSGNNRMKLYVNGVRQDWSGTDPGDYDPRWNGALAHQLLADGQTTAKFNGYASDITFLDGQAIGETGGYLNEFGAVKEGIWIPKNYSGSYGDNGFRLEFKGTGTATSSGAVSSPTNIGDDSSGQNNHFAVSGFNSYDSNMPDSPENNFATMNSLIKTTGASGSLTEGNLKITKSGLTYSYFQSSFGVTKGKWYAEIRCNAKTDGAFMIGITEMNMETYRTGENIDPHLTAGTIWYSDNGYGHYDGSGVSISDFSGGTGFSTNQVVGLALDMDSSTKTIKFYVDGSLVTTKNLTANFTDHIGFACNWYNSHTGVWNFGQDSTFAGDETATTNADGNGIGAFHTSPPSGYLALCSANLDDDDYATIGPTADNQASDFFATTFYAGTDDATRAFDLGFVSDWAWFKADADGYGHQIYDSSRGVQKYFRSNTYATEATNSEGLLDFKADDANDTSVDGSGTQLKIGTDAFLNESGTNVSLWTWRINGGTTSSISAGSVSSGVPSASSTVQVNTTVGMSQVLYTGNATGAGAEQTIGHGLGVIPEVIMFKSRTYANMDWYIHHKGLGNGVTTHIELNVTDAEHGDADYMNEVAPTASVFSLGYNFTTNKSGETYIAYCFNNVEGYSKFGKFTGNGDADGAFVYTGFRPAWVMIKNSDQAGSWMMMDIARSPINIGATANALVADNTHGQSTVSTRGMDFLSNGFKIRTTAADMNNTGQDLIYFAFAEDPFKYANAK